MDDKNKGLYSKYKVERIDGKPMPEGCIVLEFKDPNARKGIKAFSEAVLQDGYKQLSEDLESILLKWEDYEGFDIKINDTAKKHWMFCDKIKWHNKTILEYLALIASEVGEAINECRGDKPNFDKLELELADIILRTLDMSNEYGIDMAEAILRKMKKNETRDFSHKKY